MNGFEKFVYAISAKMPEPGNFGWFHLMFLGIMILTTVLLCVFCRNCSEKTFKRIMMIS